MDRAAAVALLHSQHSFPSDHAFHVIVRANDTDPALVSGAIADHFGLADLAGREARVPSSGGRYLSLRLTLPCTTAEAVLDAYALFARLPAVVRYF